MLETIKKVFSGILEGIVATKQYNANRHVENYLSKSIDHADLKRREEKLKHKEGAL